MPASVVRERTAAIHRIAPLLGRREPLDGESLMSLVARTCDASGFRRISNVLGSIGITSMPPFLPFTQVGRIEGLAALLRVRPDQVRARMHPGGRDVIDWWGEPLRRVFLEAKARRYSPTSLRISAHHRATWMIRPLPFCPESYELLRSDCPACGRQLGWSHTRGVDRCEHCDASLADAGAEMVDYAAQVDALRVANLISVDAGSRERGVASLPAPFNKWRPGDVFEATVELGVAVHHLHAKPDHKGAIRLGDGRYEEITTPILLSGLRILDGWPDSLTTLVDQIGASANTVGSTGLDDCLGPLAKFFQRQRAGFPLVDAIAAEAATAFRAARIPVKSTALSRMAPPEDDGLISEKEVLAQYNITQPALRRLDGRSDIVVLRRASVSKLYDRERLGQSISAYRSSRTATEAVRILGVPDFALPALARRGLIDLETDQGAVLLSGSTHLVTTASLTRLASVEGVTGSAEPSRRPLAEVLRHIFSPEAWASALESALSRRVVTANAGLSLTDRLLVEPPTIYGLLTQSAWSFPGDAGVSCIMAGKLIGQGDVLMSKAVTERAIAGTAGSYSHTIRLADLYAFDRQFAFTNDIANRLGCSPQGAAKQLRAVGIYPSRLVYRMAIWDRRSADQALTLSPHPQFEIDQQPM